MEQVYCCKEPWMEKKTGKISYKRFWSQFCLWLCIKRMILKRKISRTFMVENKYISCFKKPRWIIQIHIYNFKLVKEWVIATMI